MSSPGPAPGRDHGTPDALYLVVFQDVGTIKTDPEQATAAAAEVVEAAGIRHLDFVLRAIKDRLQTTTCTRVKAELGRARLGAEPRQQRYGQPAGERPDRDRMDTEVRAVEYELQRAATLRFAPKGLACTIAFPTERNVA